MKFLLALLALLAVATAQQDLVGYCRLVGTANNPGLLGNVYFVQSATGGNVTVNASISGITTGLGAGHGFHIHAFGNVSDTNAAEAVGSHLSGSGSTLHGCPDNETRHEGDMGNWQVSAAGTVNFVESFDLQTLVGSNAYSIIGHGLVFHALTDDCVNVPSSGSRLGQCVIGIANPADIPSSLGVTTNNAANQNTAQTSGSERAFCFLQSTSLSSGISGYVDFQSTANGVQVSAVITGLKNNSIAYGLHIHNFGDLFGNTGEALGSHYNPLNSSIHGLPPNSSRHYGDLGNVCGYTTDSTGSSYTYYYQYVNALISDVGGVHSIIGRGMALHNQTDYQGATAYGPRVAHCVIGVANVSVPAVSQYSSAFTNLVSADCAGPVALTAAPTTAPTAAPTTAPSTTGTTGTVTTTTGVPTASPSTTARATTTQRTTTSSASSVAVSVAALFGAVVLLM